MIAPLIGGILDTAFGWESIFVFVAIFAAAVLRLGGDRAAGDAQALDRAGRARTFPRRPRGSLPSSPRFFGYALCAALNSATFFSFLGGAPHVVVTMMGRTSAEYGLWFFVPSLGYMAGNFTARG